MIPPQRHRRGVRGVFVLVEERFHDLELHVDGLFHLEEQAIGNKKGISWEGINN